MKTTMALLALLLAAVLSGAASCSPELLASADGIDWQDVRQVSETFERQLAFADAQRLVVENDAGRIQVTGWTEPGVGLSVTKWARDAAALAELRVDVVAGPDALVVRAELPRRSRVRGLVEITLMVPLAAAVSLSQGAGEIGASNLQGLSKIDLGAGELTLEGLVVERLDVSVGAGEVTLSGIDALHLTVGLGTGELSLDAAAGAKFESLEVSVGTGQATLGGVDAQSLRADVGMGDLNVGLVPDAAHELAAEVGIGELTVRGFAQMDITRTGLIGHSASGRIGAGGGPLNLSVGIGELEVYPQPA